MRPQPAILLEQPPHANVEAIARRQSASLMWQPVDRAPLGIWVNRPEHRADLTFEDIFDYRSFFQLQMRILADTLSVGSDITPALAINSFGDGILPSMFGADLVVPAPDSQIIQDQGPWVIPLLHSEADILHVRVPGLESGLFPKAADAVRYYRDHAPDWLPVVSPMRMGPLSIAMLLCGQSFYTNLYDYPKAVHHLLQVCTDLFLETEHRLFELARMSTRDTVTNFGVSLHRALRVGDDVVINLRPELIEEFVVPYYRQIADGFGGKLLIHCCSMPHNRCNHIINTLSRHPDLILGVSTQLGAEYYLEHQRKLAGSCGMEAGYGVGITTYKESFGSFRRWAEHLARSRNSNSGLVLYTEVPTLAEAHSMWKDWLKVQGVKVQGSELSHRPLSSWVTHFITRRQDDDYESRIRTGPEASN